MITIERDDGLIDKVCFSLRFGFETEIQSRQFSMRLAEKFISHEVRGPSKWSSKHKINIHDLEYATFDGLLLREIINDMQMLPTQYDFFLGITSAYQLGGFTVPNSVVKYIQIIGGNIEVSYSCSYSED